MNSSIFIWKDKYYKKLKLAKISLPRCTICCFRKLQDECPMEQDKKGVYNLYCNEKGSFYFVAIPPIEQLLKELGK
jgi:hypothetical protein